MNTPIEELGEGETSTGLLTALMLLNALFPGKDLVIPAVLSSSSSHFLHFLCSCQAFQNSLNLDSGSKKAYKRNEGKNDLV